MSKSNKFVERLAEASGGWENFLYETLKEVCTDVGLNGFTGKGEDSVSDAQTILEAYEEQQGVTNSMSCPNKPVPLVSIGPDRIKEEQLKPTLQIKTAPVAPQVVQPRKMTGLVGVDKDAGGSQGELPIPTGYRVVNKHQLIVTTRNGMELGRGSPEGDGQVRGQEVSGQVSNKGVYRFVFKEVTLGSAVVHFEILPIPPAPVDPPRGVPAVAITPAMVAAQQKAVPVVPLTDGDHGIYKKVPVDPSRPEGGVKEVG